MLLHTVVRIFRWGAWLLFASVLLGPGATANTEYSETGAQRIEELLISPCCWGGTVAEHSSPAALHIKKEIRAMLAAGKTEPDILGHFEKLHGERILARPKAVGFNLMAWILPVVLLLIGTVVAVVFMRDWKRPNKAEKEPTSAPAPRDDPYVKQIDRELYGS